MINSFFVTAHHRSVLNVLLLGYTFTATSIIVLEIKLHINFPIISIHIDFIKAILLGYLDLKRVCRIEYVKIRDTIKLSRVIPQIPI